LQAFPQENLPMICQGPVQSKIQSSVHISHRTIILLLAVDQLIVRPSAEGTGEYLLSMI
jgi:hypothetical protein